MFKRKTLFVIGAGTGHDLNMPLGGELSRRIASSLQFRFDEKEGMFRALSVRSLKHGDAKIRDALHVVSESNQDTLKSYIDAARTIGDAVENMRSIDNFVLAHRHDEQIATCAKIAIVHHILHAERECHLGPKKGGFKYDEEVRKSWLHDFLMCLLEGVEQERNLENIFDNVAVITFNYDRCLEHFLLYRLMQTFPKKGQQYFVNLLTKKLKIAHPYGVVGKLPWQVASGGVDFGAEVSEHQLATFAPQIRTYSERIEEETALKEWDEMVSKAECIIFLGFHFHQPNVDLLISSGPRRSGLLDVYATTTMRSDADLNKIGSQIGQILEKRGAATELYIADRLDCKRMFVTTDLRSCDLDGRRT